MVGHTGVIPAVDPRASRRSTRGSGACSPRSQAAGGVAVVTADHGNAEQMLEADGCAAHGPHHEPGAASSSTLDGVAAARRRAPGRRRADGARAAWGCAAGRDDRAVAAPAVTRVYVSLPLRGPSGHLGRDVLRGAELAFERRAPAGVELVVRDTSGAGPRRARRRRRRGGRRPTRARWRSSATSTPRRCGSRSASSAPAGLLHVAPVATQMGLRSPTLVRLTPDDEAGARAIAALARRRRRRRSCSWCTTTTTTTACRSADAACGRRAARRWRCAAAPGVGLGRGAGGRPRRRRRRALRRRRRVRRGEPVARPARARIRGSGCSAPTAWPRRGWPRAQPARRRADALLRRRPRAVRALRRRGHGARLDAIAAGGGDRAAVAAAARGTRDRDSLLGRYSVDADGAATGPPYGRLRVAGGELDWDRG